MPDDEELKRRFSDTNVEFVWRPPSSTFADYKDLHDALGIQWLSEHVEVTLQQENGELATQEFSMPKLQVEWSMTKYPYHEGYDLESREKPTGAQMPADTDAPADRYIEVKSTDMFWDGYGVGLTPAEYKSATTARDQLYTIDDMADDLNADKYLDALHNIDSNVLYNWMHTLPSTRTRAANLAPREFIGLIHKVERGKQVTAPQRRINAERTNEPLLLVQGPPGTGKSHTIGWAILYRMLNAAAEGHDWQSPSRDSAPGYYSWFSPPARCRAHARPSLRRACVPHNSVEQVGSSVVERS